MIDRKAQVEVQFNWIFILIVGAVLLAFFVTISVKQKSASEQQLSTELFLDFGKILFGADLGENRQTLIVPPSRNFRFDCSLDCRCGAYQGTSRSQSRLFAVEDIIFSPTHLNGDTLLLWSKEWNNPYHVTDFVFVTSPEIKYYIEDTARGNSIFHQLPNTTIMKDNKEQRAFDKEKFSATTVIQNIGGNYKFVFIFTDSEPESFTIPSELATLDREDVTAIKIDESSSEGYKKVIFYQKSSANRFENRGESYVFGDTPLLAAIFADNRQSYVCMMNNAFEAYSMITQIYNQKQNLYITEADEECKIHYVSAVFNGLISFIESFDFLNQQVSDTVISTLHTSPSIIAQNNENAIQSSCPHIY